MNENSGNSSVKHLVSAVTYYLIFAILSVKAKSAKYKFTNFYFSIHLHYA